MKPNNAYWQRRSLRQYRGVQVVAFFVALYLFALVSLILPLRPTYSETEKRELTPFPAFTLATFWDGSFFQGMDKWFSDTFPFRETLIEWNTGLWSLSGIHENAIHGDVQQGDEIPDVEPKPQQTTGTGSADSTTTTTTITTGTTTSATKKPTQTTAGKGPDDTGKAEGQQLGAIYLAGNAAYEYYTFNLNQSNRYVDYINGVGDKLAGKANVYDIIVPNSMGVMLSDGYKEKYDISTSDQKKAIAYMESRLNKNVHSVPVFDVLQQHADEYIYFRTDHHWTADGAYYAYQQFATQKGLTPTPLSAFQKKENQGFLGTFYAGSDQSPKLGNSPDTVVTYTPASTNALTFTDRNGTQVAWNIVMDGDSFGTATKYSAFIGGDNPYAVIQNPTLTDGSSCVVVKESYGNAFVPFLVDHYQTVHVIDYRYYTGNLLSFVEENGVQDVVFLNNIMATSTSLRIDDLIAITE